MINNVKEDVLIEKLKYIKNITEDCGGKLVYGDYIYEVKEGNFEIRTLSFYEPLVIFNGKEWGINTNSIMWLNEAVDLFYEVENRLFRIKSIIQKLKKYTSMKITDLEEWEEFLDVSDEIEKLHL